MNRLLLTFQPARQEKNPQKTFKCQQFLYNIKAELKALLRTIKVAEMQVWLSSQILFEHRVFWLYALQESSY